MTSNLPSVFFKSHFSLPLCVVFVSFLIFFVASYAILAVAPSRLRTVLPPSLQPPRRVMLVTAHPDDECLFFGPSLAAVIGGSDEKTVGKDITRTFVLCLSQGTAHGSLGRVRPTELIASCGILGIPSANVAVVDDPGLQDGFENVWDKELVASKVLEAIKKWNVETLLTFDDYGISGHPNHIAVYRGVRHLVADHNANLPSTFTAFSVISLPLYRKYLGFVEVLFTWVLYEFSLALRKRTHPEGKVTDTEQPEEAHYRYLVLTPPRQGRRAMLEHRSQFVWFRKLNTLFSRYMMANELVQIT
ncbi:hypothetical protein HDU93_006037 [Gonapodya sp. JEL0774]|nr:hypothetical protein HDU93_006037 [Gonapodya sp. JEL0774]